MLPGLAASAAAAPARSNPSVSGVASPTTGTLDTGSSDAPPRWMVRPLTCTLNCEAPITVARTRWPGSITGTVTRFPSLADHTSRQLGGEVAVVAFLGPEHVLGHAAGEGEVVHRAGPFQRLGQRQGPAQVVGRGWPRSGR